MNNKYIIHLYESFIKYPFKGEFFKKDRTRNVRQKSHFFRTKFKLKKTYFPRGALQIVRFTIVQMNVLNSLWTC